MGLIQPIVQGRERAGNVELEGTYGTYVKPTAGGSIIALDHNFTPNYGRELRNDALPGSRDWVERFEARQLPEWEVMAYALAQGVDPLHYGNLMKLAFGQETDNGTTVTYDHALEPASASITMFHEDNTTPAFMEAVSGAVCEDFEFSYDGENPPRCRWAGPAKSLIQTATGQAADFGNPRAAQLNGALTGGETTVTMRNGETANFEIGSVISIGTSTNHEITDIDHAPGSALAAHTMVVTPAVVGAQGINADVVPHSAFVDPEIASPSSLLNAVDGELKLGNDSKFTIGTQTGMLFAGFDFSLKNNWRMYDRVAFQRTRQDGSLGRRDVEGTLRLLGRRSDFYRHMQSKIFNNRLSLDILFGAGTVASQGTNSWLITFQGVEFDPNAIDIPEDEQAAITLPFRAFGSSRSATDAVVLTTG